MFVLDVLPAHSTLLAELDGEGKVRFQAKQERHGLWYESVPSGWFNVADKPIDLAWAAFEFEEGE